MSYETLTCGNNVGESPYTSSTFNGKNEFKLNSGSQKSYFGDALVENYNTCDQVEYHISKYRILSWRKRKLQFRSRSFKVKGELLLKKHYGEEGGDDIDYDRRVLSSSDEYTCQKVCIMCTI